MRHGPAPVRLTGNQIAARALAGMAVGQLLVFALDRLIDGPGAFVLFGL